MIKIINYIISVSFTVCYAYQFLYMILPLFIRKKPVARTPKNRYGVLICARNEEAVIHNLLNSLKAQDYPAELFDVFVLADNCTDRTAEIARNCGAEVFVRHDRNRIGKGFALDFLLKNIYRKYGRERFDGFFVFDADNVLEPDYITQMDRTFCEGHPAVTGYRNSKNYGDNWISAGYSLWFLRESQFLNRPRYLLGTSCGVSGTGFLVSRETLEKTGGWNYFLLTEDIEFTTERVAAGERIAYCERAVLYDEQPTGFGQSVRQRLRWSKGYFQVLRVHGAALFRGIFSKNGLSCLDMALSILPALVLSLASVAVNLATLILALGDGAALSGVLLSFGESVLNAYLTFLFIGGVTLVSEWRNIRASARKKILYLFTFPAFMSTYIPISLAALFVPVAWKPIAHRDNRGIDELRG